jgi:hypothetical protein
VLLTSTKDALGNDDMFDTMRMYSRQGSTIAASSGSGTDSTHVAGVVQARTLKLLLP